MALACPGTERRDCPLERGSRFGYLRFRHDETGGSDRELRYPAVSGTRLRRASAEIPASPSVNMRHDPPTRISLGRKRAL